MTPPARLVAACLVFVAHQAAAQSVTSETLVADWQSGARNADLALNLGVRYARADDLGRATLWLERAHHLAPRDRQIEDALGAVRGEIRRRRAESSAGGSFTDGEPAALSWWRTFGLFSRATYAYTLLAATWLLFGALLARRRTTAQTARDALATLAVVSAIAAATAATWWAGSRHTAASLNPVVVIEPQPRGRSAPDELAAATRHPDLYAGAVGLIRDQRGAWSQIELVDGHRLWVDAHTVARIVE